MLLNLHNFGEDKGRGFIAKQNIPKQTILFKETPLVQIQYSWNKKYKYVACEFCMKPLEDVEENVRRLTGDANITLPYKERCLIGKNKQNFCQCSCGEMYCSSDCRDKANNSYHQVMCPNNNMLNKDLIANFENVWNNMHYPPETSNLMIIIKIVSMVFQTQDKETMVRKFSGFCQSTSNESNQLVLKLLNDKYQENFMLLFELFKSIFADKGLNEQWFTFDGFLSLVGLVCRNSQGIATNSYSYWLKINNDFAGDEYLTKLTDDIYDKISEHVGDFIDNEGIGLFENQSLINHSCDPNCEVKLTGYNNEISVMSLRDIKLGEEVTISYLDEHDKERSRHSRQKQLREFYLFNCQCSRCLDQINDIDVTSDEEECCSDDEME